MFGVRIHYTPISQILTTKKKCSASKHVYHQVVALEAAYFKMMTTDWFDVLNVGDSDGKNNYSYDCKHVDPIAC